MKKLIIIILFIGFVYSCSDGKSKLIEEKLRGKGYKYWLFIKAYPSPEKSIADSPEECIFLFYFDKYGKYYNIYKYGLEDDITDDRDYSGKTDIINTNRWSLKNDSVLIINNMDYFIKKLESDMMILQNLRTNVYYLYIVAPDSLLPSKYHCIQT
ncbi:MAG: hypothetical protein ACK5MK_14565 [Dysgonomonas sp.]